MTIAKTILSQIKTLDVRATWAWGASNLVDTGTGLQFKVGGMAKFKGQVLVTLNEGTDLYDIEFFKVRKGEIKVIESMEGVFAEDLVSMIDSVVQ
jgi:hypothetical protein